MSDTSDQQPAASQVGLPGHPADQDEGVAGSGPGETVEPDTGPDEGPHDTSGQPALSKSEIKGRQTDDYESSHDDTEDDG
jgi:hypothetical protein